MNIPAGMLDINTWRKVYKLGDIDDTILIDPEQNSRCFEKKRIKTFGAIFKTEEGILVDTTYGRNDYSDNVFLTIDSKGFWFHNPKKKHLSNVFAYIETEFMTY